MEYMQRVPKTDLSRKTRQVIRQVQRGYTVLVESHGQAEAVIMDIADYRIVRAFLAYHTHPPRVNPKGISAERLVNLDDPQLVYNLVLAHHQTGAISLGRASELLGMPALELQFRFQRLDVPLNLGAEAEQAVFDEVNAARNF